MVNVDTGHSPRALAANTRANVKRPYVLTQQATVVTSASMSLQTTVRQTDVPAVIVK